MKRRQFIKGLGATTALVAVAPMTALAVQPFRPEPSFEQGVLNHISELPLNVEGGLWVRLYDIGGNEANYRGYAPQYTSQDAEHWLVEGNMVSNNKCVAFPVCTGNPMDVSMFGITDSNGTVIYKERLTSSLFVSTGITPEFLSGGITISDT